MERENRIKRKTKILTDDIKITQKLVVNFELTHIMNSLKSI